MKTTVIVTEREASSTSASSNPISSTFHSLSLLSLLTEPGVIQDGVAGDSLIGAPHSLVDEVCAIREPDCPYAVRITLATQFSTEQLHGFIHGAWFALPCSSDVVFLTRPEIHSWLEFWSVVRRVEVADVVLLKQSLRPCQEAVTSQLLHHAESFR